jgi:hypothetical protein
MFGTVSNTAFLRLFEGWTDGVREFSEATHNVSGS